LAWFWLGLAWLGFGLAWLGFGLAIACLGLVDPSNDQMVKTQICP
jgi:hypothetical protein